ncbi:TRIM2 [Branchiostoma lanceolatum]|uniref:TRIM2 protein n=1 Tax=Branchiostoma lanceolatum TaxID=7740 RepID=A0A8J9YMR4_BRALA|nr:TRIM2 [Branchiostoma lanceolatum]
MAEASFIQEGGEGESPSLDRSLQMNMFDCSICLQMFTRPKVLPCGHTFCKDCLVTYVKGGWSCKCPTCKRPAYLNGKKGSEGVESLTDNISLGNLRDDFASLTIINKQGREVEHHVQLTNQQVCVKHYGMEVKFYCPSCEEVICGECIVDEHNTHGVTRLSKALEKQAEQAKELMGEGKRWIEQVRGKITETEEARKMLKFEEETQCLLVNKSAACLKKVLTESVDKRATDIKEELNALFALKRVALTNCKEELETLLATLLNGVEEVDRTVQSARKPVVSKSPETTSAVEEFIQSVLLKEQATSDEVPSPPSWMPNHPSAIGTHTPQPLAQPKPARKERTEQQQPAVFRARQELSTLLQGQGPRRQLHVKRGTKKVVKPKDAVAKSLISEVPRRGIGNGGSEPIPPHSDSSDASNSQTDVMPIVADSSVEDSSASAKVSASSEGAAATFKFDDANGNSSDLDI